MLLCAVLRGDALCKLELADKVKRELDTINLQPESKMSTDIRAFLLSVLYIATQEQPYFNEAMAYFNSLSKPSDTHRQLIKFLAFRY